MTASADENAELFWARARRRRQLRRRDRVHVPGASGVRRRRRADVLADRGDRAELLAAYREYLPTLPRNVGAFFCFHTIPPGPPFPEEIHLRKVCGIVWCIVGSDEEAEKAMAPMLAVGDAAHARRRRVPLPALNSAFDGLYGPGDQWYWRADFVNEIPDEAIAAERGVEREDAELEVGLAHLSDRRRGARRRAPTTTPWAYRDTRWSQVIIGVDPDPAGALRRCATGRSATGRRCTRTRPAAPTSTS